MKTKAHKSCFVIHFCLRDVFMLKKPTRNKKLIRQMMLLTNPRSRRSYFQLIKEWNPVWHKERSEILLRTLLIYLDIFYLPKMGKNCRKASNFFLVWKKDLCSNYASVLVDWIDFDILTNCSLTCTCGSHVFFVYMTYWVVDPLRSAEERKQKWHVCF